MPVPPLPRPFPFSQVPSGLPLVYLGCPLPFPGESRGVRGEVEGNGGTSEKGMAMVFNKLLEEGGGRQEGVGRISVQVLGSPHLLGWLSPQRLVQPLPSTLTAGPPSCLWHPWDEDQTGLEHRGEGGAHDKDRGVEEGAQVDGAERVRLLVRAARWHEGNEYQRTEPQKADHWMTVQELSVQGTNRQTALENTIRSHHWRLHPFWSCVMYTKKEHYHYSRKFCIVPWVKFLYIK